MELDSLILLFKNKLNLFQGVPNCLSIRLGSILDPNCRVQWVDTAGSFASRRAGTRSLKNFGNIYTCLENVMKLLHHQPSADAIAAGVPVDITGSSITIVSPYKEDIAEFERQLRIRIEVDFDGQWLNLPRCVTIDKMQGGENEIVHLLLPAHHPNFVGFMRDWNRWNVALTRAKCIFWT